MDFLLHIIVEISGILSQYLDNISLAFVVTLIVLYGGDLNRLIRGFLQNFHFLIRMILFVVVCVFGYGTLTLWLQPLLLSFFESLSHVYLSPVIFALFLIIGILAERKSQI